MVMSFEPVGLPLAPLEPSTCFLAQDCFGFSFEVEVIAADNVDVIDIEVDLNEGDVEIGDYIEITRGARGVDYFISEIIDLEETSDTGRKLIIEPLQEAQRVAMEPNGGNQVIRISRMRAAFEPLVLYPYGAGGLVDDALTTLYVVPAAEGDVLL